MKVVIIGNGIAGNTAAATIRQTDPQAEVTIISEEAYPHYSACVLPQYLAGEIKRQKLFIRTKKSYHRDGIKAILGQKVHSIDPDTKRIALDSKSVRYDRLILATGSSPIMPPIEGIKLNGVFPLKLLSDADQIRSIPARTAVIVGTGPIGVEAGIALSKHGIKVYLIELLDRIMPRIFDQVHSAQLENVLEKHGITVFTKERVTRITGNEKVEGVVTDKRTMECDLVIMAAGMRPIIDLAQQAGLTIGSMKGISVNDQMQTSFDDIYACGDCAEAKDLLTGNSGLSLLWHNAKDQGKTAGYNCSAMAKTYSGSINITSLDVLGTHAVSFGNIETDSRQYGDIEIVEKASTRSHQRFILSRGRLIGAQSIGDSRDMGLFLYALVRKDRLKELKEFGKGKPLLPEAIPDYQLARYLTPATTTRS